MSYSTAGAQKFTLIDELPELDDLEGPQPFQPAVKQHHRSQSYPGATMLPNGQEDKFGKFIRKNHAMPNEAGMSARSLQAAADPGNPEAPLELYEEPVKPTEEAKRYVMPENSPSCLTVAEHMVNCPICSKFYNDDKTIYIIAIVVLAVISILLLKKVLNL